MNTIKLYLHAARMLLKSHLQYPASFCLQTLAQIVMQSGELLAVLLIIRRFDGLNQWTGGNLLFFFGVVNVTWYLTEFLFRGVTCLGALVQAGTLDVFLLRPRGVITQAICHQLDPRRIGTMAVGMAALVMGARQSAVQWTLLRALALTEGVAMGAIMILGLFLLEGMLCIHTVKSIEMVNTLTYGGDRRPLRADVSRAHRLYSEQESLWLAGLLRLSLPAGRVCQLRRDVCAVSARHALLSFYRELTLYAFNDHAGNRAAACRLS